MKSLLVILFVFGAIFCDSYPQLAISFEEGNATVELNKGPTPIKCKIPHEHYACGSACQTECSTLGQPCGILNIRCNDACYCDRGYARNAKGRCISISKCPQISDYRA